jgi:iron complex outermembrane receptor protein
MSRKAIETSLFLGVTLAGAINAAPTMAPGADASATGDSIATARRPEERLQVVPISITVSTPQAIADRNVITASDLAIYTPSLSIK